jgi:hypothetical protein
MALDDLELQSTGTYTSGGSSGGSESTGESQSTSTPQVMDTAQSNWGLMQSQLLSALADKTYNWAMDQYAKGEGVTDQTIANFLEMSGKGKGLADTLLHQYQDQIKPLMDNYIREAGTYASEGRQRFEAGKAMSTVAQADTAAMAEIERKLEGQGINVNSGRIQEQMIASRVADAAARAGAGTEAAQRTQDIGRQMTEKALAMGQKIPGQAVDAIQSAYAGLTGAENAILGLLNTGKNLADAAAPYHNAAVAANKLPTVANATQSTSTQKSSSQQGGTQGGGGGGGKKGGGEGAGRQPAQPRERQPGGGGRGDGDGRGDGGTGQRGIRDTGAYGKEYRNPLKAGGKKEDDGTGEPDEFTGPTYIDPNTGAVTPEFDPKFARDPATGELYGPDTPQWDAPGVSNWSLPDSYNQPSNVDSASAGGDNYQLGGFGNLQTTWDDIDRGQTSQTSTGGVDESGFTNAYGGQNSGSYQGADESGFTNAYGGQDFGEYNAGDDTSDFTDAYGGQDFSDYDGGYQNAGYGGDGDYQYDAGEDTSDWSDAGDSYDDSSYDDSSYDAGSDTSDWTDAGYDDSDYGGGYDDSGYYDYGGGGDDYEYYDASGGGDDYSYDAGGDYSDWSDGGDYGGYDEYARGGRVRPSPRQRPPGRPGVMPTTGGAVPRSVSPSRGRQTDDISARLNAGEYVIPRDVVKHQGTKFFTDLIAKSRKLRTGMTGAKPGPTMRPALPQGRPTFSSRPLPPR